MGFKADANSEMAALLAMTEARCTIDELNIYRLTEENYCPNKLSALRCLAGREGFDMIEHMIRNWESGANRFVKPGEALYAAELEGRIVGICGRGIDPEDWSTLRLRHSYVLPEWRELGIGGALFRVASAGVRPGQFRKLVVRAYFRPARSLSEKVGFRFVDRTTYTHEMFLA